MNNEATLKNLQGVIDFVWNSDICSFYRDFWMRHGIAEKPYIQSLKHFSEIIPRTTKNDLLVCTNPYARAYLPSREIRCLTSTSGTTSAQPLFKWHTNFNFGPIYKLISAKGGRTQLYIWSYNKSSPLVVTCAKGEGVETILADPRQIEEITAILTAIPVDILHATPSVLLSLKNYIGDDDTLLAHVRFLATVGEPLTQRTRLLLTSQYPNAEIYNTFSFVEAGCSGLLNTPECNDTHAFHINDKHLYAEVLSDNQLAFSSIVSPHVMPLIRYIPGDTGEYVSEKCTCGLSAPRFRMTGRKNVDYVRIQGVEVRIEHIEAALRKLEKHITPFIDATVIEQTDTVTKTACLHISLMKRRDAEILDTYLETLIRTALLDTQLSSTTTLGDAITRGLFTDTVVTLLETHAPHVKNKRIQFVTK